MMSNPKIATCPDCKAEGDYQGDSHEGVFFRCPDCEGEWIEEYLPVRHCSECGAVLYICDDGAGYCEICREIR
jgi:hypothetical protein